MKSGYSMGISINSHRTEKGREERQVGIDPGMLLFDSSGISGTEFFCYLKLLDRFSSSFSSLNLVIMTCIVPDSARCFNASRALPISTHTSAEPVRPSASSRVWWHINHPAYLPELAASDYLPVPVVVVAGLLQRDRCRSLPPPPNGPSSAVQRRPLKSLLSSQVHSAAAQLRVTGNVELTAYMLTAERDALELDHQVVQGEMGHFRTLSSLHFPASLKITIDQMLPSKSAVDILMDEIQRGFRFS
ncbi:hypothetical protein BU23DRAFT_635243 [Bimuria novae-zelandiae CBS 107.79]|uniref:Uncharacterized protein n=1 Tax=Bimuria novae-zelandiae CBS 107.79 TaxID=1447943 RepID=A0A6A5VGW2_9PLEO|nr:hypothetical protein BU23DRAFT_635243 [Bimuria novae-zelandiae CBS 107.79]